MPRIRHDKPLMLTEDERRTLEQWARRPKTAQRMALRARIVLGCADGLPNRAVAGRVGTHTAPKVIRWFVRHPRYHLHFTPTSASWLNQVERSFSTITTRRIRRAPSRACPRSRPPFMSISRTTTITAHRSPGPRPPTSSWTKSVAFANELQGHDTRDA
jgi:hypothetical protein